MQAGHSQTVGLPIGKADLPRVGLYPASFDPVHAGHIRFALEAQKLAGLNRVYFVPERRPERHAEPEHYVHRSAMVQEALRPYEQFALFELPDARLTNRSLTRVTRALAPAHYSLLLTADDLLQHDGSLPLLYHKLPLVIAVASHTQMAEVLEWFNGRSEALSSFAFVDTGTDYVSSVAVRRGLRANQPSRGLLPSVRRYSRQHWLYLPTIHQLSERAQ